MRGIGFAAIFISLVGIGLAGCGSSPTVQSVEAASPTDKATASVAANQFISPNQFDSNPETYRIGNQDLLEVTVFQVPDMSRTVRVSDNLIVLPLIGPIKAVGLTVTQLQSEITARAATYLQSPQVNVNVKEFNSQQITVEGAVKKPGVFPISQQTSLLQAIAMAQGLDQVADPSSVVVFRNANGGRQAAKFDVAAIRNGSGSDPMLQPGDVVVVPKSGVRSALQDVLQVLPIARMWVYF